MTAHGRLRPSQSQRERCDTLDKTTKYFLVEASALPDVFLKVAEAKRMLETGEAATIQQASTMTGISRSAYYKYRDSIMPFHDLSAGRIMTFHLMLKDEPGVLSSILMIFADSGANILTINQSIPSNGCASVSISSETRGLTIGIEELLAKLSGTVGVVKAEIPGG